MTKTILDIQFDAAINDIVAEAQLPLNKEIIERWLSDYEDLWASMKAELENIRVPLEMIHGRSMTEFYSIYSRFTKLKEYYRLEELCGPIMAEYSQIMAVNPSHENLKSWTARYEKLGTKDLLLPPIERDDVNYARTIYGVVYFISGSEFKNITNFSTVFSNLFWDQEILPDSIAEINKQMELRNGEI